MLRGRHLVSLAGEQLEGCLQAVAVLLRALEVEGRRLASVGVGARVAGGVLVEALGERECLLGLVEVAAEVFIWITFESITFVLMLIIIIILTNT